MPGPDDDAPDSVPPPSSLNLPAAPSSPNVDPPAASPDPPASSPADSTAAAPTDSAAAAPDAEEAPANDPLDGGSLPGGTVSAAPGNAVAMDVPKLQVGYNYPWAFDAYGSYFGGGNPPGSSSDLSNWVNTLKPNLAIIKGLGFSVVRIFLMCNCNNWGSVTRTITPGFLGITESYDWAFTPPASLHPTYLQNLDDALAAFKSQELKVILSFVDFGAALKQKNRAKGGGGRYKLWTDAALREQFFDMALEPLLDHAVPYADQIFAFEVMNEPIWATWTLSNYDNDSLSDGDMTDFLRSALSRIAKRDGLKSTVGHRFERNMSDFPTGDVRQFHYYPAGRISRLGPYDGDLPAFAQTGAVLGEFGASVQPRVFYGDGPRNWPEIADESSLSTRDRVHQRLQLIQRKGYETALIWPDLGGAPPGPSDPLKLSADAQDGIKDFFSSP